MHQMQLVTYTEAIPVTSSTVFRLWTGRGTDRWLTTSMNGPGDKTNIYQAFVKAKTTQQAVRDSRRFPTCAWASAASAAFAAAFITAVSCATQASAAAAPATTAAAPAPPLIASTRLHRLVSECSYLGCTVDTPTHFSPLPSSPS